VRCAIQITSIDGGPNKFSVMRQAQESDESIIDCGQALPGAYGLCETLSIFSKKSPSSLAMVARFQYGR
jgi:hypothetical protein